VGDDLNLTLDIANGRDSAVATSPQLTVTRARSEIGSVNIGDCSEAGNDIVCNLPEIPAGGVQQLAMKLTALEPSPNALLQVTVSADQADASPQNNSVLLPLTITEADDTTGSTETAPPSGNASKGSSSGGGAVSWAGLLLLLVYRRCQRTMRMPNL
jgi:hypothetical protein